MKLKYLLVPGYVQSRSDGDWHYISPWALPRLYGVRPEECTTWTPALAGRGLIPLWPRSDGDYSLPEPPGRRVRFRAPKDTDDLYDFNHYLTL